MTGRNGTESNPRLAIGIDFGGSGIKAAVVDVDTGEMRSERLRTRTPQPSTPDRCIAAMREMVEQLAARGNLDSAMPVGLGVPAVTIDGIVLTATNIHSDWLGYDAASGVSRALTRLAATVNDADAAGLAEMRFGAGRGRTGTVLIVTLGTGIGSALFRNGELVPNTELGHIEIRGKDAEVRASSAARTRRKLSWEKWAAEVNEYLRRMDALIWPDLIIVGGGVSKDADKFLPRFTVRPPVVAAKLRNEAGIVGAAIVGAAIVGPITVESELVAAPVAIAGVGPGVASPGTSATSTARVGAPPHKARNSD
jgi:polyphosphate glucokinase